MPDLDVLILVADYYEVEIRDILDGERKSENMNEELKETVLKVADYSNEDKLRLSKRLCILFAIGILTGTLYVTLELLELNETFIVGAIKGFSLGVSYGMLLIGFLYTSGFLVKIRKFKLKLLGK